MKNILLIGATGTLGTALTERLISDSDYNLIQFARHVTEKGIEHDRVRRVDGDALSKEDLKDSVAWSDVVICMVSGEKLPKAAKMIVSCMKESGKKRLIFTGAVGIYNEIPADMDGDDNVENEPAQIPNREGADIVETSGLDYTIIRPGYLRDGEEQDFVITLKGEPAKGYKTSLPSLTGFILKLLQDDKLYIGESVSITRDMRMKLT